MLWGDDCPKQLIWSGHAICRLDGLLRLEIQSGRIPTVPDDPLAARLFKTGPNSVRPAPFFPGLRFGPRDSPNEREDLFGITRVESYLVLYRWPKAGETVDLTERVVPRRERARRSPINTGR